MTPPLHPFVPSTKGIVDLIQRSGFRVTRVKTNSDYGSTAGSLQIRLNRGTDYGPAKEASEPDREAAIRQWREWWSKQNRR